MTAREKGLTVPVVKAADQLSFAETEQAIRELALRARDNKLTLDDFKDGTFTISNGGVFGSLAGFAINHDGPAGPDFVSFFLILGQIEEIGEAGAAATLDPDAEASGFRVQVLLLHDVANFFDGGWGDDHGHG